MGRKSAQLLLPHVRLPAQSLSLSQSPSPSPRLPPQPLSSPSHVPVVGAAVGEAVGEAVGAAVVAAVGEAVATKERRRRTTSSRERCIFGIAGFWWSVRPDEWKAKIPMRSSIERKAKENKEAQP